MWTEGNEKKSKEESFNEKTDRTDGLISIARCSLSLSLVA